MSYQAQSLALSIGAQCQDKQQWALSGAQAVPSEYQEALL